MLQRKTYQYKLNPTPAQQQALSQWVGACRYVYNLALEYKKTLWGQYQLGVTKYSLQKEVADIAKGVDWLNEIDSHTLRDATDRLYKAYDKYFRDLKSGEIDRLKAAYVAKCQRKGRTANPIKLARMGQVNFVRKNEYGSIGFKRSVRIDPTYIQLPKLGRIRYRNSRQCEGIIKHAVVIRKADGWYISLHCETDIKPLPPVDKRIGIDVGIKLLLVTSDGEVIDNPKHLRKSEHKLKRLQRSVSRKQKGSNNRKKAVNKLARQHQKVANSRKDFHHKLTTCLIRENQAIAVESLQIKNLLANHHLAKSIGDAGWSNMLTLLEYKANWYGRSFVKVPAHYTSQDCSTCGYRYSELTLSIRKWICPACGSQHERDVNAAINIKNKAAGHAVSASEVYAPVGAVAEESFLK